VRGIVEDLEMDELIAVASVDVVGRVLELLHVNILSLIIAIAQEQNLETCRERCELTTW
jgi:hypothetical protein